MSDGSRRSSDADVKRGKQKSFVRPEPKAAFRFEHQSSSEEEYVSSVDESEEVDVDTREKVVREGPAFELEAGSKVRNLGLTPWLPPNPVMVEQVDVAGWADQHGIKIGCEIMKINGLLARNMTKNAFIMIMNGRPLRLKILPPKVHTWGSTTAKHDDADRMKQFGEPDNDVDEFAPSRPEDLAAVKWDYEVVAEEWDTALGFAPTLPPHAMVVQRVEMVGWAMRKGIQVGHELMIANDIMVEELTGPQVVELFKVRPLKLQFFTGQGKFGGVGITREALEGISHGTAAAIQGVEQAAEGATEKAAAAIEDKRTSRDKKDEGQCDLLVSIISAEGLRKADTFGSSDPCCVCEVVDRREIKPLRTPTIMGTTKPMWDFQGVLEGYRVGDVIKFSVQDVDIAQNDNLGKAVMIPSSFLPGAFEGPLNLTSTGASAGRSMGTLQVRVELAGHAFPAESAEAKEEEDISKTDGAAQLEASALTDSVDVSAIAGVTDVSKVSTQLPDETTKDSEELDSDPMQWKFHLIAEKEVTRLGFVPAGLPPEKMLVWHVEPDGWAKSQGLLVGDEILAVNYIYIQELKGLTVNRFKQLCRTRPLRLDFAAVDGMADHRRGHRGEFLGAQDQMASTVEELQKTMGQDEFEDYVLQDQIKENLQKRGSATAAAGEWVIQVDRSGGQNLGLQTEFMVNDDTLKVVEVTRESLVAEWNAGNINKAVHPGDMILEVNGRTRADKVLKELERRKVLNIVLARSAGRMRDMGEDMKELKATVKVTMVGAEGLQNDVWMGWMGGLDPYCVCMVKDSEPARFIRTPVVRNTHEPVWDVEGELDNIMPKDSLEFSIWSGKTWIRVTVIGAQGLEKAGDVYCIAETLGQAGATSTFKTPTMKDTQDPLWNHMHEIPDYHWGEDMKFTVWSVQGKKEKDAAVGMALLGHEDILPGGCHHDLALQDAGVDDAWLEVRVEVSRTRLTIIGAKGLRKVDVLGSADPYISCKIKHADVKKPETEFKTPVIKNTRNPVWNFVKDLGTYEFTDHAYMRFDVFDQDPFREESLGYASLSYREVAKAGGFDGDLLIHDPGGTRKQKSTIQVKLEMLQDAAGGNLLGRNFLTGPQFWNGFDGRMPLQDAGGGSVPAALRVKLEVLQHDPHKDMEATLLDAGFGVMTTKPGLDLKKDHFKKEGWAGVEVTILEAQGLRKADWLGENDAYCVCEFCNNPGLKFETPIAKGRNPRWNYRSRFSKYPGVSLEFAVYDKDAMSSTLLGRTALVPAEFCPDGFEGELLMVDTGKGHRATLTVRVEMIPFEMEEEADEVAFHTRIWWMTIDQQNGDPLGMSVKDGTNEIDGIYHFGLVHTWNEEYPEHAAKVGDKILEVNEETDPMRIRKLCQQTIILSIKLARELPARERPLGPGQWKVKIDRTSGTHFGMSINDATLKVDMVHSFGLAHYWNKGNPTKAIQPGDQIVALNLWRDPRLIRRELAQKQVLYMTLFRRVPTFYRTWVMQIHKTEAETLGMDFDRESLQIEFIEEDGLVGAFNRLQPSKSVRPGDRILKVNDYEDATMMAEELSKGSLLDITMTRESYDPADANPNANFWVSIDRSAGGFLGMSYNRVTLEITSVSNHGLVPLWNEMNPTMAIRVGDRILEVNGQRGFDLIYRQLIQLIGLDMLIIRKSVEESGEEKLQARQEASQADRHSDADSWLEVLGDDEEVIGPWSVQIEHVPGASLGLGINSEDLTVDSVVMGGLVMGWNEKFPELAIHLGDRILEVNGKRDQKLIFRECTRQCALKFKMLRKVRNTSKEGKMFTDESALASKSAQFMNTEEVIAWQKSKLITILVGLFGPLPIAEVEGLGFGHVRHTAFATGAKLNIDCEIEYTGPTQEDVVMKIYKGEELEDFYGFEFIGFAHAMQFGRRIVHVQAEGKPYYLGIEIHVNININLLGGIDNYADERAWARKISQRAEEKRCKRRAEDADFLVSFNGHDVKENNSLLRELSTRGASHGPWGAFRKKVTFCTDRSIGGGWHFRNMVHMRMGSFSFAQPMAKGGSYFSEYANAAHRTRFGILIVRPDRDYLHSASGQAEFGFIRSDKLFVLDSSTTTNCVIMKFEEYTRPVWASPPINFAIGRRDVVAIDAVLHENPGAVRALDPELRTPLHIAALTGTQEGVERLIRALANINAQDNRGGTALHLAAGQGNCSVINPLLRGLAEVNIQDREGQAPLHIAATVGDKSLAALLLEGKADVKSKTRLGITPIRVAETRGDTALVRILKEGLWAGHPVVRHAALGDASGVDHLIRIEPGAVSAMDAQGHMPLHAAAKYGHLEVVRYLLSFQANANTIDENLWTPLHYAADSGAKEVVQYLLDAKASESRKTGTGLTALALARQRGHQRVASLLLGPSPWLMDQSSRGGSPLHYAAGFGREQVMLRLLRGEADPNSRDFYGRTPLHYAASEGKTMIVNFLIQARANVQSVDEDGCTPGELAEAQMHTNILKLLGVEVPEEACSQCSNVPAPHVGMGDLHGLPLCAQCWKLATEKPLEAHIVVTILGAKNLRRAGMDGKEADPFCVCEIQGKHGTSFQTEVAANTRNPIWKHSQHLYKYAPGNPMKFSIFDKDRLNSDLLGWAMLSYKDFCPQGYEGKLQLKDAGQYLPEVWVRVEVLKEPETKQELGTARIRVTVARADGLRKTDVDGSDPYCVCEIPSKKELTFKTAVIYNTEFPVWNFSHVVAHYPVGDPLQFTVWDEDDDEDGDDLLGTVTLDSLQFYPDGFVGHLPLTVQNAVQRSTLDVQVEVFQNGPGWLTPASQGEALAMKIDIRSAQGLCAHSADVFCVCEVLGKRELTIKTPQVKSTRSPVWNHEQVVSYSSGDGFSFSIWDDDVSRDKPYGKVFLPSATFFPKGFEGSLHLEETARGAYTILNVKVSPVKQKISHSKILRARLRVIVVSAQDLPHKILDPYCVCEIPGKFSLRTPDDNKTGSSTRTPVWNDIQVIDDYHRNDSLEFSVWDTAAGCIGTAKISASQFFPGGFDGDVELLVNGERSLATLTVRLESFDAGQTMTEPITAVVHLIGASGLSKGDADEEPSCYCRCEIMGKKGAKQQTPVIKDTVAPLWGYAANFTNYTTGDSFLISVWKQDGEGGRDHMLGTATLNKVDYFPNGYEGPVALTDPNGKKKKRKEGEVPAHVDVLVKLTGDAVQQAERLNVTVVGAQRLRSDSYGFDRLSAATYCVCEALAPLASSSMLGKFETPVAKHTWSPKWEHTQEIGYYPGYPLEFVVFQKDGENDIQLGRAQLDHSQFEPEGFDGEVCLEEAGKGVLATLMIKVKPLPQLEGAAVAVKIVSARGLRAADIGWRGKSDPYCVCQVVGKKAVYLKTRTMKDTLNPVWNDVHRVENLDVNDNLLFEVWDDDTAGDDLLGRYLMPQAQFYPKGFKGDVVLENAGKGVEATLTINIEVLQLSSLPAPAIDEATEVELAVVVKSATNLRKPAWMHSRNTYCLCQIPGKPESKFQTKVKEKTTSPVWNRGAVVTWSAGNFLEFSVWDEKGEKDEFLGKLTLNQASFYPAGFSGAMLLADAGKGAHASLQFSVCQLEQYKGEDVDYDPEDSDFDKEWMVAKAGENVTSLGVDLSPPPENLIALVQPNGWAASQGILQGSAIVEVNGLTVEAMSTENFYTLLKKRPLQLLVRKPSEHEDVVVVDWEEVIAEADEKDTSLGLSSSAPPECRVKRVDEDSWAAQQGLAVGAQIMEVNGLSTDTMPPEDFWHYLRTRPLEMLLMVPRRRMVPARGSQRHSSEGDFEACVCGSIFEHDDEMFCRKCGTKRPAKAKALSRAVDDRFKLQSEQPPASPELHLADKSDRMRAFEHHAEVNALVHADESVEHFAFRAVHADESLERFAFRLSGSPPEQVFVDEVEEGGWAESQDIQVDDEIIAVNGLKIEDLDEDEFYNMMKSRPCDLSIKFQVEEEQELQEGELYDFEADEHVESLGLGVANPPECYVGSVDEGLWADSVGIQVGDHVVLLNDNYTETLHPDEFMLFMQSRPLKMTILIPATEFDNAVHAEQANAWKRGRISGSTENSSALSSGRHSVLGNFEWDAMKQTSGDPEDLKAQPSSMRAPSGGKSKKKHASGRVKKSKPSSSSVRNEGRHTSKLEEWLSTQSDDSSHSGA